MKHSIFRLRWVVAALLVAVALNSFAAEPASPRERLLMDNGWKFHMGNFWGNPYNRSKGGMCNGPANPAFSEEGWRTLNLPHDWVVELPFDRTADESHGFKPVGPGFGSNDIAWYRREFTLPKADSDKRLWLEFDGVFRDCQVFVNGWFVGHHEGGYNSFRYDITDVANCGGTNGGVNTVAVLVDASRFEGWFYEGAGIYRHVWLVKTAPVAISPDGVFVYSSFKNNVPEGAAKIHIETSLSNSKNEPVEAVVKYEILSPDGKRVTHARQSVTLAPQSELEAKQLTEISSPILWSPETHYKQVSKVEDLHSTYYTMKREMPALYKLVTTVAVDGKTVDRKETEFGIRTVGFDADRGFMLNGRPYELKGTCNHQDMAGVGAALPDSLQYFRIARLKEMGCNAYRTSHNPPTPELLDACDHLGMLVMDESRLLGTDEENLSKWDEQIRRDRNHPSVAIWSICNEEEKQNTPDGGRVGVHMQEFVKRLDPTRPVTAAENIANVSTGFIAKLDVRGWNYNIGDQMDNYHKDHPAQPNVGTEQASTVCTRGIYFNDKKRGYVSAYDANVPAWAHSSERWYSYFAARPWLSGGFVWTGFDYRGEPTPYSWPCINSHFGILDMCGFPKDNFYYYQAWWMPERPVLHLLPHWNWPGKEGKEIEVDALSNCGEVELFLNGQSLGRKTMKKDSRLKWMVKYAPGTLSAKGYTNGKLITETKIETTGEPAAVQIPTYRSILNADGEDADAVTISVVDAQGRTMPVSTNLIHFEISGPGKIIGVGNGDPSCHEPDVFIPQAPVKTIAFDDWRWKALDHVPRHNLPQYESSFDDSAWDKASSAGEDTQMGTNPSGVFRQHLTVTDDDFANSADIRIRFGYVHTHGWYFVNGQFLGDIGDSTASPGFSIKKYLRNGDNVIAVGVIGQGEGGGLSYGVHVEMEGIASTPHWQRSVFNGLAQVIVQSTREPGEIKLTATADGLQSAVVTIKSQVAVLRASVP